MCKVLIVIGPENKGNSRIAIINKETDECVYNWVCSNGEILDIIEHACSTTHICGEDGFGNPKFKVEMYEKRDRTKIVMPIGHSLFVPLRQLKFKIQEVKLS